MSGYRRRQSSGRGRWFLLGSGLLLLGIAGTLGILYATGTWRPGEATAPAKAKDHFPKLKKGWAHVLLCPRNLPAGTKLTRELLWETSVNPPYPRASTVLPIAQLPKGAHISILRPTPNWSKLLGRVLKRDKAAKFAFSENDLYPKGTRPGLVSNIPPGKRALRLRASKLGGLFGLGLGDRFDIVAIRSVDAKVPGVPQAELAIPPWLQKQARVRLIVKNGLVVQPVHTRKVPQQLAATLTRQASQTTKPVQELVIAVEPEEVVVLLEAMEVGETLRVLPRSGLPGDPADKLPPERFPSLPVGSPFGAQGDRPVPPGGYDFNVIERIGADGRRYESVPVPGKAGTIVPDGEKSTPQKTPSKSKAK